MSVIYFPTCYFGEFGSRSIQYPQVDNFLDFWHLFGNDFRTGPYFILHAVVELSWEVRVQTFLVF